MMTAKRSRAAHAVRGWRAWLARYVLLAIAWPSIGALPWMMLDLREEGHLVAEAAFDHDDGVAAHAHHDDADIPGSPTHPLDHDCAQCQVLKHLARCVLPDPVVAGVPPPAGAPVQPCAQPALRYASLPAEGPPIRGPPLVRA
jgi:hypothetical protein